MQNKISKIIRYFSSRIAPILTYIPGSFVIFGLPRKIINCKSLGLECLYPVQEIIRKLPKTIHQTIHWKLLRDLNEEHRYTVPASFADSFEDGIANRQGALLDCETNLIADLSKQFDLRKGESHKITKSVRIIPKVTYFYGSVATIAFEGQQNYFHWMFDALPQFHLMEKAGFDPEYLYIECHTHFQKQSLEIMGYGNKKIIDSRKYEFISASQMIAPSFPGKSGYVTDWACQFLRERFLPFQQQGNLPLPDKSYRRIYLSRKDATRRKVLNEVDVTSLLESLGFLEVQTDGMALLDQVRLFNNAEIVIAPHGAGLTNLIFCNTGTKAIELFSPHYVNGCYWTLCEQIGLDYYYLIGEGKAPLLEQESGKVTDNIKINVHQLEEMLVLSGIQ